MHYPKSDLPIRDIRKKPEPHIEIGAENYVRECLQPNIRAFCNNHEGYLFLTTRNENGKFIVGYICRNQDIKIKKGKKEWTAVKGKAYLVNFEDTLRLKRFGFKENVRGQYKLDKSKTKEILKLIHKHKNIIKDCIKEMEKCETKEKKKYKCLWNKCKFKEECLRNI
jgi:hypothetical protein